MRNRGLDLAKTAVQPEAHWALRFVCTQRREHDEALRHLDSALRLNPSYADAYAMKAGVYTYVGQPQQSVSLMRTALRLNPDVGSLYFMVLGRAYFFLGDSEQARVNLEHALQSNSENLEARIFLAATDSLARNRDDAVWQANEVCTLEPRFDVQTWLASYPLTDAAQKQRLVRALNEIGL